MIPALGIGAVGVTVETGGKHVDVQQGADGGVVVNLSTRRPAEPTAEVPELFETNLLDSLSTSAVSSVAGELDEGIRADIQSRQEFIDNYNAGLEMLGLRLEDRGVSDKTSKVRHPLLLWGIIKFQANSRGEMLPSDGPAKIKDLGDLEPTRAEHLERRFNWYLTKRATEYYPDTDRALFYIGYGGSIHKKVYRCPRRRRPVSEAVYLPDLVISNDTTDIDNASRVTHVINGVTWAQMMGYMEDGYFADVPLSQPMPVPSSSATAEAQVVGVKAVPTRPADYTHTLWECTAFLDFARHGLRERGAPDGVPLPYVVTMDRDSKQLYRVSRGWRKDDPDYAKKKVFFKWGMIPGVGYLDLGFLHLLGNHTRALTALERILIDAGIFSNFPGGIRISGSRLESNEIMAGPGQFPEIDSGGTDDIRKTIMALPFKGPTAEVLALMQELQKQGEAVAGVIDISTKDGKSDVPVGTMMAQIEQQSQVSTGVHKRLHTAQGEELSALRELLADQPELLVDPDRPQDEPITAEELRSANLEPVSDPNIPTHIHRLLQAIAIDGLTQQYPDIMNRREAVKRMLDIGHVADPDQLIVPPAPASGGTDQPDPTAAVVQVEQAKIASREKTDLAKVAVTAQAKAAETQSRERTEAAKLTAEQARGQADREADERYKTMELRAAYEQTIEEQRAKADEAELDRRSREDIAAMNDQTTLIVKGIEAAGEPTEGGEARDKKKGP